MPESTDPSTGDIEQLVSELRTLADEAGEDADRRKRDVDLSDVDTSHMALAEKQGMRQAFEQAWRLAISKRDNESNPSTKDTDRSQ
jgi:hypothetical protein